MRLLNTSTLKVEEFLREIPEYVILSHTWEEDEVSLQDMQCGSAHVKKGYAKIKSCCKKAAEDGFEYCWIDTCCIDKTSSAELSESINSMYLWYKNSRICYAYIADFDIGRGQSTSITDINEEHGLGGQRWFERGWTLQELIAPPIVEFYDTKWNEIGTRLSLQEQLTAITGISNSVLQGGDPTTCKVAVRMSWAARRKTTRIEDEAYCLMGLFGVNMPLLYGEGSRAFRRLQEEIQRVDEDYTLFAWSPKQGFNQHAAMSRGLLAHSPSDFAEFKVKYHTQSPLMSPVLRPEDLYRDPFPLFPRSIDQDPPYLTSRGLRITLPLTLVPAQNPFGDVYACLTLINPLGCGTHMLCVKLRRTAVDEERYVRKAGASLVVLPYEDNGRFEYRSIYVHQPSCSHPGSPPWELGKEPSSSDVSLLVLKLRTDFDLPSESNTTFSPNEDTIGRITYIKQTSSDPAAHEVVDAISSNIEIKHQGANETTYAFNGSGQGKINYAYKRSSRKTYTPSQGFKFAFDDQPATAFEVHFKLEGNSPTCRATPCNFPKGRQLSLQDLQDTDRVALDLKLERGGSDQEQDKTIDVQASISIRRVAAQSPHFFSKTYKGSFSERYDLSIDLKNISTRRTVNEPVGVASKASSIHEVDRADS
ncbi:Nn.00g061000.m01.CDS01 [Neocucurbitaria sp. VM-36]